MQVVQRQMRVQQARLLRTPQEPNENECECVTIQVRHCFLGVVRRSFPEPENMACVYDWVGSLSLTPENFQLLDYAGKLLLPSQPLKQAQNTTLYMREVISAPPLEEEDDEVTFLGFGDSEFEPWADANYSLQPVMETPPQQLMECDERYLVQFLI